MHDIQLIAVVLAATLLAGCVSSSPSPAPAQAPPAVAIQPETGPPAEAQIAQVGEVTPDPESPDDLICRREVEVGTHFARRICRTRAEIETAREASQRSLREMPRGTTTPQAEPAQPF